jgi:hypothetical protein
MFRTVAAISGLIFFGALSTAHATTDIFECRAKIVDLKTNDSTESVGSAAGYRMVTPNSSTGQPYPSDMEVTKAEAKTSHTLNGKTTSYKVDFNLQYGFAKRPIGNPTEARQYICNQVSLQGCQNGGCSAASNICLVIPDPFDPKYGWSQTSLSQNVPVFNEQLLRPLDTIIPIDPNDPNGAHVTVSCKFQGTYL